VKAAALALLRLVVSGSILALVLWRVPIPHPAARMADYAALYLAAALGIVLISVVLVALRWRLLARWLGLAMPALLAVRALFLGMFVGQLLPSALGTDLMRGGVVARQLSGVGRIAASVVADRLVALFAVCLLFTIANPVPKQLPPSYAALLGPAAVLVTGAILAVFLLGCGQRPRARPLLGAIGIALAVHGLSVVVAALAARAYGVDASLRLWVSVVPLAVIASALPISINGWGVREATIVALAAPLGVSASEALLVSLTIGALNMIASLPGGLVMLRAR
jgi:uncharacterized membrane protein YbhN (UPF0104 family)